MRLASQSKRAIMKHPGHSRRRVQFPTSVKLPTFPKPKSWWVDLKEQLDPISRKQLTVITVSSGVLSLGIGMVIPVLPTFAAQWGDLGTFMGLSLSGATGIGLVCVQDRYS